MSELTIDKSQKFSTDYIVLKFDTAYAHFQKSATQLNQNFHIAFLSLYFTAYKSKARLYVKIPPPGSISLSKLLILSHKTIYLGCHICQKPDVFGRSAVFTLEQTAFQVTTVDNILKSWNQLHMFLNNFGVIGDTKPVNKPSNQTCSSGLEDCLKDTIVLHRNCTTKSCNYAAIVKIDRFSTALKFETFISYPIWLK